MLDPPDSNNGHNDNRDSTSSINNHHHNHDAHNHDNSSSNNEQKAKDSLALVPPPCFVCIEATAPVDVGAPIDSTSSCALSSRVSGPLDNAFEACLRRQKIRS